MKKILLSILVLAFNISLLNSQVIVNSDFDILPFGEGGQIKMTYDTRQRPNCVFVDGKVYIVFNAGAEQDGKDVSDTKPMAVTYDLASKEFSHVVTLGPGSNDHHDGPVIWVDMEQKLHVFYGWHHDLGTHLISNEPLNIGTSINDWSKAPAPAPKMSYEWMSRIYENKQLVFYRTDGHYSSWTYCITADDGKTWEGSVNDVTDLDINGGMDTDWSIYTSKGISNDGNFLHVGFIAYDDYRRPRSPEEIESGKLDKSRQFNPLYDNRRVSYDYNLYYVKINLRTHEVMNDKGEILQTPIDLATANSKCMIWDTEWRGGSIVPSMLVDENDQVSFLHNISDFQHEDSLDYHYVRFVNGEWKHTRITHSNHEWNSGYLTKTEDGTLHAFVITGEGYFHSDGYMDRYGGGSIEEWISADNGDTWEKLQVISPDTEEYSGWKFNNVQPVKRPDGSVVEGMLLFYGWKDPDAQAARAFLLIDHKLSASTVECNATHNPEIFVFPNPATHTLTVSFPGEEMKKLMILNLAGQNLYDGSASSYYTYININHLTGGTYLLKAESSSEVNVTKFIKLN